MNTSIHISPTVTRFWVTIAFMLAIAGTMTATGQMSRSQYDRDPFPEAQLEVYRETSSYHGILRTTGTGKVSIYRSGEAQARLLAQRSARVRGFRNLLRALHPNHQPVRSGVLDNSGFLRGAVVLDEGYDRSTGTAYAEVAYFLPLTAEDIRYFKSRDVHISEINAAQYRQRQFQSQIIDTHEWKQWQRK